MTKYIKLNNLHDYLTNNSNSLADMEEISEDSKSLDQTVMIDIKASPMLDANNTFCHETGRMVSAYDSTIQEMFTELSYAMERCMERAGNRHRSQQLDLERDYSHDDSFKDTIDEEKRELMVTKEKEIFFREVMKSLDESCQTILGTGITHRSQPVKQHTKIPQIPIDEFDKPVNVMFTGLSFSDIKLQSIEKRLKEISKEHSFRIYTDGWKDGCHSQLETLAKKIGLVVSKIEPDWKLGHNNAMLQREELMFHYAKSCQSVVISGKENHERNQQLKDKLLTAYDGIKVSIL